MKKIIPALFAIVLIILVAAVCFGTKLLDKYSYSKEYADLDVRPDAVIAGSDQVAAGMVFEARSSLANLAEFAGSSVGVTYVKVFFGTLFLSAIFSIMLAGLLLGFNLIAKNNMTFKNALCLASVRSIVIAPAMVVALIIILINVK